MAPRSVAQALQGYRESVRPPTPLQWGLAQCAAGVGCSANQAKHSVPAGAKGAGTLCFSPVVRPEGASWMSSILPWPLSAGAHGRSTAGPRVQAQPKPASTARRAQRPKNHGEEKTIRSFMAYLLLRRPRYLHEETGSFASCRHRQFAFFSQIAAHRGAPFCPKPILNRNFLEGQTLVIRNLLVPKRDARNRRVVRQILPSSLRPNRRSTLSRRGSIPSEARIRFDARRAAR